MIDIFINLIQYILSIRMERQNNNDNNNP